MARSAAAVGTRGAMQNKSRRRPAEQARQACQRRLCEPWCSPKQRESHCRSCKCHCPFCGADAAGDNERAAASASCTDGHPGCTTFTTVLSCSSSLSEVATTVPRIIRRWYPAVEGPASGGTPLRVEPATTLRELCCASCSLPAAPQGKATAALPTPRATSGGGGGGGGGGARVGMLMPLRASGFWWGVRFAQSMLACGQQADQCHFYSTEHILYRFGRSDQQADAHGCSLSYIRLAASIASMPASVTFGCRRRTSSFRCCRPPPSATPSSRH